MVETNSLDSGNMGAIVDTITDIQAHPTRDECLLSASKDGTVRMWNILTGKCLMIFEIKASVTVSPYPHFMPAAAKNEMLLYLFTYFYFLWN